MSERKIVMHATGPWVGCDSTDEMDLPDDWEDMDGEEQEVFLREVAQDNFNNSGFDWWAEVVDA